MRKLLLLVFLCGCAEPRARVTIAVCDSDGALLCEDAFCEGDNDAYVVCGRSGAYCRKYVDYVDRPVDNPALCLVH